MGFYYQIYQIVGKKKPTNEEIRLYYTVTDPSGASREKKTRKKINHLHATKKQLELYRVNAALSQQQHPLSY